MNRRDFIINGALVGLGSAMIPEGLRKLWQPDIRLTILHTNDMHSRIEPFPANAGRSAGMGGMARRASMIKNIRQQETNVLLLDSGDVFQGTPYFNFFGGELEFKLMSQMGYDAATLGNHDFDGGLQGLDNMLPHARFPFLSANYDFSKTQLANRFEPYKIFNRGELKIGVFGLGIELKGLVPEKLYRETVYLDPVEKAREMVQELQGQQCHYIICLSHLGYQYEGNKIDDHKLAEAVSGIDLILGGHTHTFLKQPVWHQNAEGFSTLINQVGWAGINLGRIDVAFSAAGKKQIAASVLPVVA
ncbi:bifunctional metallophosphatase/5'-nucleotidase [bacterium]|nr:bifunctional metallophosphatase/5'-nucleotidase [bacterium]